MQDAEVDDADLVKVFADLPNHWWMQGESLWAKPLGDDLYELRNVPFCAYGLSYRDVVHATSDVPDRKPEIRALARSGGHRTFRVIFGAESRSPERQAEVLADLKAEGVSFERANGWLVAIDLDPTGDREALVARLDALMENGVLHYETCEARAPGSFDALPEDESRD